MAVSKAKQALFAMRECLELPDLPAAAFWAQIYLAESMATDVGHELREKYGSDPVEYVNGNTS